MSNGDEFGHLLHRLRRARDLTQEALGQACFCSRDTVKKLEAGQRRPSRQLAAQLADVLGLTGWERAVFLAVARAGPLPVEAAQPLPGARSLSPTPHPAGTVTFLFTDIEEHTRLWEQQRTAMQEALPRQEALLRDTLAAHGGYVYKMIGDVFQVAFSNPHDALAAALAAQRRLTAEDWGELEALRVRMALDSGMAEERGHDYVSPFLNRLGRLLSTAHGGQILLSRPLNSSEPIRQTASRSPPSAATSSKTFIGLARRVPAAAWPS